MKPVLYQIECLTNLHVGSGEVNYSVIDNEVERDPVLGEPVIHASGVKGALRDYYKREMSRDETRLNTVFGTPATAANEPNQAGTYKFFSAHLLARPLRVSRGSTAFILATSSDILAHFSQLTAGLGIDGYPAYRRPDGDGDFLSNAEVTVIEGKAVAPLRDNDGKALFEKLFGKKPFAIAKKLTDYALPVVARNCLGENKNLWYEELVPHQSLFYFVVLVPEGEPALDFPKPVQFGGNASVGYGYTKVTKLWEGEQG